MTELNEKLTIERVHDNDAYIVKRVITERMNGAELRKVYEEIKKAYDEQLGQVREIPKQAEEREKALKKGMGTLRERLAAFKVHAEKLPPTKEAPK